MNRRAKLDSFLDSIRRPAGVAWADVSASPGAPVAGAAYRVLLAPDGEAGGTGADSKEGIIEPPAPGAPRPGKGKGKAAEKPPEKPAAKPKARPKAQAAADDDDDEDAAADDDDDEDAAADDDEEDAAKPAAKPAPKGRPKKVEVSAKELKDLQEKARRFDDSEAERARKADERAREREDATAATDPVKALDSARRRHEKQIADKDKRISELEAERDDFSGRYLAGVVRSAIGDTLGEALEEAGASLRPGARVRLMRELADRFEAVPDEDSTDPRALVVVDRESGEPAAKSIPKLIKEKDYELFLDFGDQTTHPPTGRRPRTPAQPTAKPNSYSATYKQQLREQSREGYIPPRGVTPKDGAI
jgi:hypothetical protein